MKRLADSNVETRPLKKAKEVCDAEFIGRCNGLYNGSRLIGYVPSETGLRMLPFIIEKLFKHRYPDIFLDIKENGIEVLRTKYSDHPQLSTGGAKYLTPLVFHEEFNTAFIKNNYNSRVYTWTLTKIREFNSSKRTETELIKTLLDESVLDFHSLYSNGDVTEINYGPVVLNDVRKYLETEDRYYIDSSIFVDQCIRLLTLELIDLGMTVKVPNDRYLPIPKNLSIKNIFRCSKCSFSCTRKYYLDLHIRQGKHDGGKKHLNYNNCRQLKLLQNPVPTFERIRVSFVNGSSSDTKFSRTSKCNFEVNYKHLIELDNLDSDTIYITVENARFDGLKMESNELLKFNGWDKVKNVVLVFPSSLSMRKWKVAKHVVYKNLKRIDSAFKFIMLQSKNEKLSLYTYIIPFKTN